MQRGDGEYEDAVERTVTLLHGVARRDENAHDACITYKQLSDHLADFGLDVPYHGGLMPEILGDASRREVADGRGLISALVVQQGVGLPSSGFFKFARSECGRSGLDVDLWLVESRRIRREHQAMA
jgi:hypothetical protein